MQRTCAAMLKVAMSTNFISLLGARTSISHSDSGLSSENLPDFLPLFIRLELYSHVSRWCITSIGED